MDLIHPQPHPAKKIIKEHGISIAAVANYLDLSFTYVTNLLNGVVRITPENEKKLQELIKHLEDDK